MTSFGFGSGSATFLLMTVPLPTALPRKDLKVCRIIILFALCKAVTTSHDNDFLKLSNAIGLFEFRIVTSKTVSDVIFK
jgi:hypothetical protein